MRQTKQVTRAGAVLGALLFGSMAAAGAAGIYAAAHPRPKPAPARLLLSVSMRDVQQWQYAINVCSDAPIAPAGNGFDCVEAVTVDEHGRTTCRQLTDGQEHVLRSGARDWRTIEAWALYVALCRGGKE